MEDLLQALKEGRVVGCIPHHPFVALHGAKQAEGCGEPAFGWQAGQFPHPAVDLQDVSLSSHLGRNGMQPSNLYKKTLFGCTAADWLVCLGQF